LVSAEELYEVLGGGRVSDEELLAVLGGVFSLSRWESGQRVSYFHSEHGHALDLVYNRHGRIARCEPGEGLTPELVETLGARVSRIVADDVGSEVRRDVLFSGRDLRGFWRHRDEWQILPAPPESPRPGALYDEHAFVLEYRLRPSANDIVSLTRRRRRYWELHLLLSLVFRGLITRENEAHPHHWVILDAPTPEGVQTAYLNEGYMVGGGFTLRAEDFSDPGDVPKLGVVPRRDYYARGGVGDLFTEAPDCLTAVFDRFESAEIGVRDQLLRASYWLDTAYRVWHESKSLSYIAAINSLETLLTQPAPDLCPACGRNCAPGPTALFRDFVEKHAPDESPADRAALYRLRSAFVHGGTLHSLDVPGAWGALVPADVAQRELHDAALRVARTAILDWLLTRA
jgi:hypothetical protein